MYKKKLHETFVNSKTSNAIIESLTKTKIYDIFLLLTSCLQCTISN